jgi:hypothetical protein
VQKEISCINPVRFQTEGLKYEITADCLIPRAKEIVITNATFGRSISIKAEEYGMSEERVYTSVVVVEEKSGAINFVLHIDDLTIPWNGEIDFSIPANYKIER